MDYFPSSDSGHYDLAGINADCAMLASMIDLNDAVTEICHMRPNNYSAPQRRRCTEYAIPAPRPPPRISPAYQWIGQTDRRRIALVPQSYLALSQVYPLRPRSAEMGRAWCRERVCEERVN